MQLAVSPPAPSSLVPATRTVPDVPATFGAPTATGAAWSLWDEATVTPVILAAIDGAREVVNVEFFGFGDVGKGAQLVSALERAARRGVEVNVFADAASAVTPPIGSYQRLQRKLRDAGATVIDNVASRATLNRTGLAGLRHVDHRKVITVDGTIGFTGGINFVGITDAYRDSMVRLTSAPAAELAADQLDRWRRVGGRVTQRHAATVDAARGAAELLPASLSGSAMHVRVNAPDQGRHELSDDYVALIRGAKERIWVSSPGYTDPTVLAELERAAARGVDVRVVAPGRAPLGVPVINWLGESNLRPLAQLGAKVYVIPDVLHRKALIADDEAVFASYNITVRSRLHDHEIGIRSDDADFVATLAATLSLDFDRAARLDPASKAGTGVRVASWFTRRLGLGY